MAEPGFKPRAGGWEASVLRSPPLHDKSLLHFVRDSVGDHDDDFPGGLGLPEGVGQHEASQRVGVIGGKSDPGLIWN